MRDNLVVMDDPASWPLAVHGVRVVSAQEYLTSSEWAARRRVTLFNLCRSYRYQKVGYYVSLLAEARGHRSLPSISTIQDLKQPSILRIVTDEIDEIVQRSLRTVRIDDFVLSVYFGKNVEGKYDRLAGALFRYFPAPLLQAIFLRHPRTRKWGLHRLKPLAVSEIPEAHQDFVAETTAAFFESRHARRRPRRNLPYDLAIMRDPTEAEPPSDEKALKRFAKAGESVGFNVELIDKDDFGRLAEFDALFIRETTAVNHRTYRFARRAAAEGLVVIDDPDSILRCTNKVFLCELLSRHKIPTPPTVVVQRGQPPEWRELIGLPCVLKQPDSAFSRGVTLARTAEELDEMLELLLDRSDLIIAQQFTPTPFDWRIGIIDRKPLYACRYYMAQDHWQIISRDQKGAVSDGGTFETLAIENAPPAVVKTALKAANLIGDGFYGVDLKERPDDGRVYLIEVNDNPSIDGGVEDKVLGDQLYVRIMESLARRVVQSKIPEETP